MNNKRKRPAIWHDAKSKGTEKMNTPFALNKRC